jgi:DNA-binding NarL/FixJ family response regulator
MNQPKRKTDIIVGIISFKQYGSDGSTFAQSISDLITALFQHSHISVMTAIATSDQQIDSVVRNSSILLIDKSLGRDLNGSDGIDLIKTIRDDYPAKPIIAMSSVYSREDIWALKNAGVVIRLKKTPTDSFVWRKAIEICADIIELQGQVDSGIN